MKFCYKFLFNLLAISLIVISFVFLGCNGKNTANDAGIDNDTLSIAKEPQFRYGLSLDSFNIIEDVVKRNQNLSDILSKHHVEYVLIDRIVHEFDSVFDVRKLKTGGKYTLFCTKDTIQAAKYFVYENNTVEYIVFDFSDSVNVYRCEKEIITIKKSTSGVITSSLWNAMNDAGANRMLALHLEDIYAWSIDFFGLQKGDNFRVIYEEQYVDSISIGIGEIYIVCFNHLDSNIFAVPFLQDSIETYFDLYGNNLKKAFLKAPLKFSRISSKFSNSRLHPVLKIRRPHHGIDYAAPIGTPVMAIGDGKIIQMGWSGGAGRLIKIKHNSVYTTSYMHLSKYGEGLTQGKSVRQGQVIGYVGSSGLSSGPHLDFRVYKNGTPIDPLNMDAPPSEPIKQENMENYMKKLDSLVIQINKIVPVSITNLNE